MKILVELKNGKRMSLGGVKFQEEYEYHCEKSSNGTIENDCVKIQKSRHVVDVMDVMNALYTRMMNTKGDGSWSISLDDIKSAEVDLYIFDNCREYCDDGEVHENMPWNNPSIKPFVVIPSFQKCYER